jgi:hypothetical protein
VFMACMTVSRLKLLQNVTFSSTNSCAVLSTVAWQSWLPSTATARLRQVQLPTQLQALPKADVVGSVAMPKNSSCTWPTGQGLVGHARAYTVRPPTLLHAVPSCPLPAARCQLPASAAKVPTHAECSIHTRMVVRFVWRPLGATSLTAKLEAGFACAFVFLRCA